MNIAGGIDIGSRIHNPCHRDIKEKVLGKSDDVGYKDRNGQDQDYFPDKTEVNFHCHNCKKQNSREDMIPQRRQRIYVNGSYKKIENDYEEKEQLHHEDQPVQLHMRPAENLVSQDQDHCFLPDRKDLPSFEKVKKAVFQKGMERQQNQKQTYNFMFIILKNTKQCTRQKTNNLQHGYQMTLRLNASINDPFVQFTTSTKFCSANSSSSR